MSAHSHILVGSIPQVQAGRLDLSLLNRNDTLTSNNLGGKFALPREFDTSKYVGHICSEGQEALSLEGSQTLTGLPYTAPGWTIWHYPKETPSGKIDDKTKQPIMVPHPMGGKPHKIAGSKVGENYVLMYRDKSVQDQVNAAYGALSTEMMVQEALGETSSAADGDQGILTSQRLNAELGRDREAEEAINSGTRTVIAGQIQRPVQRVGR